MDNERRQHLERLHQISLRRLRHLEEQIATLGTHTPAHVRMEVEDLKREISDIEHDLGIAEPPPSHEPHDTATKQMLQPLATRSGSSILASKYSVVAVSIVAVLIGIGVVLFRNLTPISGGIATQSPNAAPVSTAMQSRPSSPPSSTASTTSPISWSLVTTLAGDANNVTAAAISPDGKLVVTTFSDNSIQLRESSTGKAVGDKLAIGLDATLVPSVAFNPAGTSVVGAFITGNNQGPYSIVRVWDVQRLQPVADMRMDGERVRVVAFSSDGTLIAAAGTSQVQIWEWNTQQAKLLLPLTVNATVISVAFSPDDSHVVMTTDADPAQVWDLKNVQKQELVEENGYQSNAAFNPTDPSMLVTTSIYENGAVVWELKEGKWSKKLNLSAGSTGLRYAAFSQDGQYIATASRDGFARVWKWSTRQQLAQLAHPGELSYVAFDRDGQQILTVCKDAKARVWQARSK